MSSAAQAQTDPSTTATFPQVIQGMTLYENYAFGSALGQDMNSLEALAGRFSPYGISGLTVINGEWERYQQFNSQNFVFTEHTLGLTATIPLHGGLFAGGINSGQIWTNEVYQPGVTGHTIYAFEVRMQIPSGLGMWPASWFYTKVPGENDGSEIDNPEFFVMTAQNEWDWTGFDEGPGVGAQIFSIKTNQWVWHPGLNFSADFHDYQTIWTPDAVYKYVDGTLVYAQLFKWTARGAPQLGINLAVGSSETSKLPGLQPNSLSEFPATLSIKHIKVWVQ
jgi:hypothetical protein